MNDLSQLFPNRISPLYLSRCQEEVRRCLESIMLLNESTLMETWSDELKENYNQAVDSLAAIEVYLHLLKMSDETYVDRSLNLD